jgi:hypothetical protein
MSCRVAWWLVPALAVLAVPAPPALAQRVPVYLVLPSKDGEELVRVEGGKAAPGVEVGNGVLYGAGKGKLAVIGNIRRKFVLQVYDAAAKKVDLRHELAFPTMGFLAGPKETLVFDRAGRRLYFASLKSKDGPAAGFSLDELDLKTQKIARHPLPLGGAAPGLADIPDAVGVYAVRGCHNIYVFSPGGGDVKEACAGLGADEKRPAVAAIVFLPGVGAFRVTRDGTVQRALGADLRQHKGEPAGASAGGINRPRAAALGGTPVLVWGETAAPGGPVTGLAAYDPVKAKVVWGKKLPFRVEAFTATADAGLFYLIDQERPALVEYDRAGDRFTRILDIAARPLAQSVAVIVVPEK